ncbi:WD repeat-containing protein 18 [Rhipicephalus microplus]|uniref:WD repeat-containing protein 18 n=1 Tax=Rhipicephalus microplus TaxID=6941 RepID=UPI003F6AE0C6
MASFESIFTSDGAGQLWNTCAWDVVSASVLAQYKGGTSGPRTLCLLGSDYVISAQQDKPLLRVWSLQRRDQIQKQIVCPGRVSALAASPDGLHCVAGIEDKIYLWQVSSGDLLAVVSRHFQVITCLRFTDDGGRFVSASRDGQVLVWDLAEVACTGTQGPAEPVHAWSQHSYDVTDIHIGALGGTRCYTCSADQTCRVFDIDGGDLLATVVLEAALTAVVTDPAEDHIFAGSSTGKIFEVALYKWNTGNKRPEATFLGHEGKVTCLATSLDGQLLVSGSEDCTARVWDVASKQCIHVLHHKGAVTNVLVVPTPVALTSMRPSPPTLPLGVFKRTTQAAKDPNGVPVQLESGLTKMSREEEARRNALPRLDLAEALLSTAASFTAGDGEVDGDEDEGSTFEDADLSKQVAMLKEVNKQLYSYAWNCVLRQQHTTGSEMSSL